MSLIGSNSVSSYVSSDITYILTEHKVPDHSLQCLLSDIRRKYSLILKTMKALATKYLFRNGIRFLSYRHYLIFVRLLCHAHSLEFLLCSVLKMIRKLGIVMIVI